MSEDKIEASPSTVTEDTTEIEQVVEPVEDSKVNESVEDKAKLQGWKPDGEYSAEEFIRRGELFKKIHTQGTQIREMKDVLKKLADHAEKSAQAGYQQALADLHNRKEQAVLAGDLDTVQYLDKQKQVIEAEQAALPRQAVNPAAEDLQFAEKNKSWFNSDPANYELVQAAIFFDNYLLSTRKDLNRTDMLDLVEKRIKKAYPEKFQVVSKSSNSTPSVAVSTASKDSKPSSKLITRLTPQQREIGEQFEKAIPGYTLEKYAKELESQGNLGK